MNRFWNLFRLHLIGALVLCAACVFGAGENATNFGSNGVAMQTGTLYLYDEDTDDVAQQTRVAVTPSAAELNILDGATLDVDELNILTGVTATAAEINLNDLSAVGALLKVKKIEITSTPTGSEQDTGWDLPAKSVVYDVFIDVTTAESTGTTKNVDIGTSTGESGGDADGFLVDVSVANTGLIKGAATYHDDGYVTTTTLGAFLAKTVVGTSTTAEGRSDKLQYMSTDNTARSVTYTAGSANFENCRFTIYIVYLEIG